MNVLLICHSVCILKLFCTLLRTVAHRECYRVFSAVCTSASSQYPASWSFFQPVKKKNNNLKLKTKLLCTGGHKCIFSYNVLCKFKNKLYKFSSNYILFISITMFCSYLYCSSVSSAQKLVICVYGFYSAVWCVDIWSWLFFRYLSASVISFYSLYNQACE